MREGPDDRAATHPPGQAAPGDRQTLKAYIPAQPESGVTQLRAAIGRIDQLIAATREQITQRDEQDHELVSQVVAATITGDKLDPIAARMVPGDRPALVHRLEQLQIARNLAAHKHTQAELTDPVHLAWKQACAELEREWQVCASAETADDRFAALVAFASRH
jgi:hypothetical protein